MQARLIESFEIARDVRHFVFEAPELEKVEFIPGQFVSLTDAVNGKAITRAYSIASAPSATNRFELCLNIVKEGHLSPRLFGMKPGETLDMRTPLGQFVIRHPDRDAVLIATGTVIAPFRSILQAHLNGAHLNKPGPAFTLLFGVRYEQSIMYRAEFEEMARCFPQFRFWPTLTRPGPGWTGRTGRVQAHLAEAIGERRDLDVFLCGLKLMVDDVRTILREMGFDRKQILYEKYD
jgi:CDP-4-dehydro-6-deoxyglucose reductase